MTSPFARSVPSFLLVGSVALAQAPPKPDTARRVPVSLPAIETTAPRDERAVFEVKPNVGTITITGRELTSAPRFFGEADVLRAVRALPGVNARNDYSVGMNVRGGEADQNLVLLDGYPVYNPFHMGGLFGAFVEPMVERVDFLTGAFPAMYGGRLSSVLDVKSAVEPRSGLHGSADVSMIATTLAFGSGMQEGRSTWTIAARRTYADKLADLVQKGSLPYHFRDAQAHVTRVLPGDLKLAVTAYDNTDDMTFESNGDNVVLQWGNRVIGTTLARTWTEEPRAFGLRLGDSTRVEQRLSRSRFKLRMNLFEGVLTLNNRVLDDRVAGTLTAYSRRHTRTVGYEVGTQSFNFDANYPLLLYPADTLATRNTTWGVFFDDLWRASDRWIVQAGARVDAASGLGAPIVQPCVSLKYFVNPDLALIGAYGEFAQTAHSLAREDVPIRALDFWVGSDARAPISRARHFILGAERWLSGSRALRVETFFKQYPRLVEQNPYSDPNIPGDEFLRLHGYSYGGDLMVRQLEGGRYTGWLAYSFAFSSRTDANGRRFFPGHDRRHELNLVGTRKGPRFSASARFNLATGTPYTPIVGEFDRLPYDPVNNDFRSGDPQFLAAPRNSERLPITQRIDVSFTRNGHVRGAAISPFLSIMNVYNAKNIFSYVFDYSDRPPKRHALQQLPIFPTLGVSIVW